MTVGDLARRDAEGYLYIVDRLKDMVISGGVNIYPREVEEGIFQHPGGRRRPRSSASRTRSGARCSRPSSCGAPARAWAPMRCSPFSSPALPRMKMPKHVEFIDQIPRNANGKVLKTALRARG